jgi:hypothetical protein
VSFKSLKQIHNLSATSSFKPVAPPTASGPATQHQPLFEEEPVFADAPATNDTAPETLRGSDVEERPLTKAERREKRRKELAGESTDGD